MSSAEPSSAAVHDRYAARRDRVRALLPGPGLDGLVVTDLLNIRYLTGFSGSNAVLLLGNDAGGDVFLTDPRYVVQAAEQVPDLERVVESAVLPALARRLAHHPAGGAGRTLGVETHVMTVDQHQALRTLLGDGGPALGTAGRPVEAVRVVKDQGEIEALRTACAISVAALAELLGGGRGPLAGRSERAVADALDELLLAHGADGPAFDTIVAGGPNSASPHHEPGERPLAPGDLVVIDFGARLDGYHADMTRTVLVSGAGPEPWQREIHGLVERANAAGRAAAVPGAAVAAVDEAARAVITAGDHGPHFTHGLGHGVGLAVHEDPFLGSGRAGTLATDSPVTIEPGVYLTGRGGVRIEDTVLVGRPGVPVVGVPGTGGPVITGPAVLTEFSRALLEVD